MEIAVDRESNGVQWEILTDQKVNLQSKLDKAYSKAKSNGKDPEKDDEVKKYRCHLKETNKAIRRFLGSPF